MHNFRIYKFFHHFFCIFLKKKFSANKKAEIGDTDFRRPNYLFSSNYLP